MSTDKRLDTTGLSTKQIESQVCFVHAFGFHESADLLLSDPAQNIPKIPSGVVLRAFSIELLLKSGIISQGDNPPNIHILSDLFKKLDSNVQMSASFEYEQLVKTNLEPFIPLDQFLSEQSKAFVDWRYLREPKSLRTNPENLRHAFLAIYSALGPRYSELMQAKPYEYSV